MSWGVMGAMVWRHQQGVWLFLVEEVKAMRSFEPSAYSSESGEGTEIPSNLTLPRTPSVLRLPWLSSLGIPHCRRCFDVALKAQIPGPAQSGEGELRSHTQAGRSPGEQRGHFRSLGNRSQIWTLPYASFLRPEGPELP